MDAAKIMKFFRYSTLIWDHCYEIYGVQLLNMFISSIVAEKTWERAWVHHKK